MKPSPNSLLFYPSYSQIFSSALCSEKSSVHVPHGFEEQNINIFSWFPECLCINIDFFIISSSTLLCLYLRSHLYHRICQSIKQ
jgi:hypothetical protein